MNRRKYLWALLAALPLLAGAAWAGTQVAQGSKAYDCCLDPTCAPGCSAECPPNCLEFGAAK